jgi:hypothetical protein
LADLANPGLVRRAAKVLAAEQPEWISLAANHGLIKVAAFEVRLDGSGPVGARCPCPAGGVCLHMVVAAMAARQEAARQGFEEHDAVRSPTDVARGNVRPAKAAAAKSVPGDGPNARQLALFEAVRQELSQAIRTGLAQPQPQAAERLAGLAVEARVAALPLLAGTLGTASGRALAIADHRDGISETELTSAFAQVWALTRALESAKGEAWGRLRGTARRHYSNDQAPAEMTLLPLGLSWWTTASGARGITLTCWETSAEAPRAITTARPAGSDPRFGPDLSDTSFWGVPLMTLRAGPFRLTGPRLAEDGALSTSGAQVTTLARGFDLNELDGIAQRMSPARTATSGFGAPERPAALLALKDLGQLQIDEPEQQLVWTVPLAAGEEFVLRQPVGPATRLRTSNLVALEASRYRIRHVLAERVAVRSQMVWQPVSIILAREREALFALDFDQVPLGGWRLGALGRRLRLLVQRWSEDQPPEVAPRGAIAMLRDDVRELVVALTATGRSRLSAAQLGRCRELAERLDELALGTLAGALRRVGADPSPENLLKTHFLTDRITG